MAQVFGSSLENLSEDTRLVKARLEYKISSGLSRPDYFDWPQRLVDQLVDYDPEATVVLFGANDAQNIMFQGKVLEVGSKAWQEAYQKRVGRAMRILTRGGRRVYWVGNPIMRNAVYRDRIAMMDHIYEAEAARHPGVTFVDSWHLMANDKGSYAEYLRDADGDPVLMRAPDGIHLDTRRGRSHGPGRARRHREGLGDRAEALTPAGGSVTRSATPPPATPRPARPPSPG